MVQQGGTYDNCDNYGNYGGNYGTARCQKNDDIL